MQVPQKRAGRVRLPDHMPLETAHTRGQHGLVAAACHQGARANTGHWVTWRRGHTVDEPSMPWTIDDDAKRRVPKPSDNLEEQVAIAVYCSETHVLMMRDIE